ncbi:hypothetical protein [Aeoliella mucimassa]|uniref:Uncharacterized protein n=1 Tax=Aeoliella mucimassa TaxID=2527972 RepID=A0A518ALY0_9BACT|nr:hypothetical protein [Aeoliella mucimassa]QDU55740.1 hypothetical protein Pan181_19350 [Aeoliella mucimassa]
MIHFTCDCCKRIIDLEHEVRYIVRMEVFAAVDGVESAMDDDRDYLQEIEDILNRDGSEELDEEVYQQARFDLCSECRERFIRNPLGRPAPVELGFSDN